MTEDEQIAATAEALFEAEAGLLAPHERASARADYWPQWRIDKHGTVVRLLGCLKALGVVPLAIIDDRRIAEIRARADRAPIMVWRDDVTVLLEQLQYERGRANMHKAEVERLQGILSKRGKP